MSLDSGLPVLLVVHYYHLSREEVLNMPLRSLWAHLDEMNNVQRFYAGKAPEQPENGLSGNKRMTHEECVALAKRMDMPGAEAL